MLVSKHTLDDWHILIFKHVLYECDNIYENMIRLADDWLSKGGKDMIP